MIHRKIDDINKNDLDALVTDGVTEGRTIEFKQELPGNSDGEKKEFLADVSSFANAAGGDLIFGIEDTGGVASAIPGLAGFDKDKEVLRLEQSILNGLEPRIPGLRFHAVEGFSNGPVLILRIPNSWASPHMVTFKGTSRFYTRNNAGKHQMDVGEIRGAFTASEALPERIRRFRDERLGKIVAEETPVRLFDCAKIVIHVLPAQSFTQPPSLDMADLLNDFGKLPILGYGGGERRLNLDGLLTFASSTDGECFGYSQLFRNGAIETVDSTTLHPESDDDKTIAPVYEQFAKNCARQFLDFQRNLGLSTPVFIFLSMIGVAGFTMWVRGRSPRFGKEYNKIDRDILLLPDVMVEDFEAEMDQVLRPTFDAVWQSSGFPRSQNYDEDGNWDPQL